MLHFHSGFSYFWSLYELYLVLCYVCLNSPVKKKIYLPYASITRYNQFVEETYLRWLIFFS